MEDHRPQYLSVDIDEGVQEVGLINSGDAIATSLA